ncbi:unnamed protein product [Penicillium camemberti]|uniref:Str. FM013 n=1 Tax=Penicillium camemberti (strain FM 013) TaxID=1429867 RepID=A0A0G4PBY3_PENC3|nr:unnamed protein product [Penicillium camemberti]
MEWFYWIWRTIRAVDEEYCIEDIHHFNWMGCVARNTMSCVSAITSKCKTKLTYRAHLDTPFRF